MAVDDVVPAVVSGAAQSQADSPAAPATTAVAKKSKSGTSSPVQVAMVKLVTRAGREVLRPVYNQYCV
jgi:hypothetical protein